MRHLLLLLVWGFNLALFGLTIYLKYFAEPRQDVTGLMVSGVLMLLLITIPLSDYLLKQLHKEKLEREKFAGK